MEQLLNSNLEIVVKSGFIHLPLLYTSEIEKEVQKEEPRFKSLKISSSKNLEKSSSQIIKIDGKDFLRSMNIYSLVENYEKLYPDEYSRIKENCLKKYGIKLNKDHIKIDSKLETIIFEVMPYFIRKNKGLKREKQKLTSEEVISLINKQIENPIEYEKKTGDFYNIQSLRDILNDIEKNKLLVTPLNEGLVSTSELRDYFNKALEIRILNKEKNYLKNIIKENEKFVEKNKEHIKTLLYLKDRGSLEIDGFGFFRSDGGYNIYKNTGEYALKDFNGDIYLFSNCQVGINTSRISTLRVLNSYKHPFLENYESGQKICIRNKNLNSKFNAKNIINSLETGISTMFYGYTNKNDFNGYHILDGKIHHGGDRSLKFQSNKISRNNPKIKSGEIEIKNDFI
tara:strand:- start:24299 stop:25492 length:1194 start_codon:yes stop_codon:yes gene_type:complete